ncbi:MAG: hypothetical protein J7J93_02415 [Candidatus Aenigmarchaeota archaeon]|nr:hypothetical protein [Candidatus Aenigmarchaeota archaeon]
MRNRKKGIAFVLVPIIIFAVGVMLTVIFIYTFTYHIEIYIRSDSMKSKSSLIPLTLFSCSYENGSYIIELNKEKIFPHTNMGFRNENKKIIENYLSGYCFKIEGPLELDNFEDKYKRSFREWISEHPKGSPIYRKIYLVPTIFDGKEWSDNYTFSVYKIKGDEKK